VLVAGFLGFGALAAAQGVPLGIAVASTVVIWALPGQIVLVEMHALAAPLVATVLAVMLSSSRFLPMTVMLMPEMRDPRHRPWKYYVAAQLLSLSGWTMAVARFPDIPRAQRLAWWYGFTVVLVSVSAASTAAGYLGADRLPLLGRLATYLWRGPGVLISAGMRPQGEAFTWISCVAYAIIAGVVSRMLLMPTGAIAEITPVERAIGSAAALAAYFWLTKRNLLVGVIAGAATVWLFKLLI
jgi:predicted branched-subunit amino acid permease